MHKMQKLYRCPMFQHFSCEFVRVVAFSFAIPKNGYKYLTYLLFCNPFSGVAANIKLLLKLVEDHKEACSKARKDSRRMLRVAGMMTILDMVRTRIQKCQSFGSKRSEVELRRCNTDLRGVAPRDKKPCESSVDEKEKLRRELNASVAARKSMEVMCSSLGKEKEIMANELQRKVQQLSGMEEHINDLKAQNRTLLEKVKEFHAEHNEERGSGEERETKGNAALEARNKMLSAQLVRSIDGYRLMKWKLREVQEENSALRGAMEEMEEKVKISLERIQGIKRRVGVESDPAVDVKEEIEELERFFEWFYRKISKNHMKEGECAKKPGGDDDE